MQAVKSLLVDGIVAFQVTLTLDLYLAVCAYAAFSVLHFQYAVAGFIRFLVGGGGTVPLEVDRIWGIWGLYYNVPKAIFYLLKGDYSCIFCMRSLKEFSLLPAAFGLLPQLVVQSSVVGNTVVLACSRGLHEPSSKESCRLQNPLYMVSISKVIATKP